MVTKLLLFQNLRNFDILWFGFIGNILSYNRVFSFINIRCFFNWLMFFNTASFISWLKFLFTLSISFYLIVSNVILCILYLYNLLFWHYSLTNMLLIFEYYLYSNFPIYTDKLPLGTKMMSLGRSCMIFFLNC